MDNKYPKYIYKIYFNSALQLDPANSSTVILNSLLFRIQTLIS